MSSRARGPTWCGLFDEHHASRSLPNGPRRLAPALACDPSSPRPGFVGLGRQNGRKWGLKRPRRVGRAAHSAARLYRIRRQAAERYVTKAIAFEAAPRGLRRREADGHGRHGIDGMRERAESLGATLSITSEEGQGTLLHLVLPRNKVEI